MMIPREIIEDVRARSDIVDIIGGYVNLKRAGSNYNGLCPFHSEKSPSFTVFPATQSFYCFGCAAGGDVITFVMKSDNLEYPEAVELLAKRAGITIPEDGRQESGGITRKRLLAMNRDAAKYFYERLIDTSTGRPGMEYLVGKRKLSGATIRHFGLGYSPDSFGMLTDYMHGLGYSDEELYTGFLCGKSKKTGKPYDYFRNRVIFPIIDTAGNIVAFGGRVMDDTKPKYLNTNDTPVFKKGRTPFALNFAKNHCTENLILCEGYMDVIAMHAAGFENAVASLGTALTQEGARIFAKYTKQIILTYDSDEPGQKATARAMQILGEVGLETRVLKLEGAKDPDEYIRKFGADAFRKVLNKSDTGFTYKLNTIVGKYDIKNTEDRIRAAKDICEEIAWSYSNVERELYIMSAAQRLELPADVLRSDVERIRKKRYQEAKSKESRDAQMTARGIGDRVNPDYAKNIRAGAAEESILGLLMLYPEHRRAVAEGLVKLDTDNFFTEFGKKVFAKIKELEDNGGFDFSLMGETFTPDEMGRLQKMREDRRILSENGTEVLRQSAKTLRSETLRKSATEESGVSAIERILTEKRKRREDKS